MTSSQYPNSSEYGLQSKIVFETNGKGLAYP